mmetsp:Transcript_83302/g.193519  ORF Transcript_83302/g.193519 Transcript_83302/m.193519 type:complete len:216 (-) Transcript_83302:149-796(-)
MRHVCQQVGTALVCYLTHAAVVDESGVRTGARDYDLWTDPHGKLLALIIVDNTGLFVQAVGDRLKVLGNHGDLLRLSLVAVRKMATVRQVQAHDPVVHIAQGSEYLEVGRGTAQRLYVHAPVLGVEPASPKGALLAERLSLVNELIAPVVARSGVALRVLVDHDRADSLQHSKRSEVLRGDEVHATPLPILLILNDAVDLWVHILQRHVQPHRLC